MKGELRANKLAISNGYILFMVVLSAHWFLAIICYPGLTSTEYDAKPNDGRSPEVEVI